MKTLTALQKAQTLTDLALLLNRNPSRMAYILYKIPENQKYRHFDIPKKWDGVRTIKAPKDQLKLLQSQTAALLYSCIQELQNRREDRPNRTDIKIPFMDSSHGFVKERNIVTNAAQHKRRRYVFNLDIKNFFGTINFGRVRGFFIKDKRFQLNEKVATIIAQIACHENSLPQGSPCSPVISNLVGNILDKRLSALARRNKCVYTRYADDITFSTNMKVFPPEIGVNHELDAAYDVAKTGLILLHGDSPSGRWFVGDKLRSEIESAGFSINESKTRMSLRCSRQEVTGLVVNDSPNINQVYYRYARAMCRNLFRDGSYYLPEFAYPTENEKNKMRDFPEKFKPSLEKLEGILSFIHHIREQKSYRIGMSSKKKPAKIADSEKQNRFYHPVGHNKLYRNFLQYKYFMSLEAPLVVTEGPTDIDYLKSAIRMRHTFFPLLAGPAIRNGKNVVERKINFLKREGSIIDILGLASGGTGQASLISSYEKLVNKFDHKPMSHPVIILCDNDDGAEGVFNTAKDLGNVQIDKNTDIPFYYLKYNLYVVKIPAGFPYGCIEGLFDKAVLDQEIDGKSFAKNHKNKDKGSEYDKRKFANYIKQNKNKINFANFDLLLARI